MREDIRRKLPQWIEDGNKYQICMSDDIDSLLGSCIVNKIKGFDINYFYSFTGFYNGELEKMKAIGIDIALNKGRTWDNHVTILSRRDSVNKDSANLNSIFKISRDNYTEKYAGSTALLIWSYYKLPLPKTDEGKMALLAIDSAYKGHFISKFRETQNGYLKMLEMEELIEIQNKYSQKDFEKVAKKFKLNGKIIIVDGKLETDLPLEEISDVLGIELKLPTIEFKLRKKYENKRETKRMYKNKRNLVFNQDHIFSLAVTGMNCISYSELITKEK